MSAQPPQASRTLIVFAAASLTGSFTEIGKQFEADNPSVRVAFNEIAFTPTAVMAVLLERRREAYPCTRPVCETRRAFAFQLDIDTVGCLMVEAILIEESTPQGQRCGMAIAGTEFDRVSQTNRIPKLADLITQQAKQLELGASWGTPKLPASY